MSEEFLEFDSPNRLVTITGTSYRTTMTFGRSKVIGKKRGFIDTKDADNDSKVPDTIFNSDSDDTPQKV